jgi:hypothetical protein
VAPEPLKLTGEPAQSVWLAPALTVGKAFTVTFTGELVTEHPAPFVTVTVYEPLAFTDKLGVFTPFDHK